MKIAAFILIVYIAIAAIFAGTTSAAAILLAAIIIFIIEAFYTTVLVLVAAMIVFFIDPVVSFFSKDRPYFDSEDIGREVKPYVKRIQYTELIIAGLFLAVIVGVILIFKGI